MGTKHFNGGMATQCLLGICLIFLLSLVSCSGTSIGVSYDPRDNHLLSPKKLVQLLKEHDIYHVSLVDTDPIVLESLSGTGIQVTLSLSHKEMENIGKSKFHAALWLKKNVMRFRPNTLITAIEVGHESTTKEAITSVVSTMKAIYSALSDVSLDDYIKIMTTLSSSLLQDAFSGRVTTSTKDLKQVLSSLLDFISETGSFLVVNTIINQNSVHSEDLSNLIVAAATNVTAFLQYPDIRIAVDVLCLSSSTEDIFLNTKNIWVQVPNQGFNKTNMLAVLVKMRSLNCSPQKGLGRLEQFPSTSRELFDMKSNTTRNDARVNSSLIGETTPTTPVTTPITTPTTPTITPTTPVTTPVTTPIITPTTPTTPTAPMTTPVTTPTTPMTPTTPTTPTTGSTWCIAKPGVADTSLQVALDYACGLGGADCSSIQQGGACYNPDTVAAHASYAFDNYYKKNGMSPASCDFGGNAEVTTQDPSSGTCTFSAGSSGSSVLNTSIGTGGLGNIAPTNSSDAASIIVCLPIFFTLICLILSILVGQRL